jgi:hypothetical protein
MRRLAQVAEVSPQSVTRGGTVKASTLEAIQRTL